MVVGRRGHLLLALRSEAAPTSGGRVPPIGGRRLGQQPGDGCGSWDCELLRHQPTTDHSTHERILVSGVVQGVGFRPFVYRLARELGLSGHVGNDSTRVFIDVHGTAADVERFVDAAPSEHAATCGVDTLSRSPVTTPSLSPTVLRDRREPVGPGNVTVVPPDVARVLAVSPSCATLPIAATATRSSPAPTAVRGSPSSLGCRMTDRRRPRGLPTCPAPARVDYADPGEPALHAQPIGCHDCGPTVRWLEPPGSVTAALEGAFAAAAGALAAGRIVAVKGIGGFHVACDATSNRPWAS